MEGQERSPGRIVGGVDTHKDLHVAAVVDELDRVLASRCFATTRHGYKQMVAWMGAFGSLQRVGIEATGTYGAGLLRYMQKAGIEVLEVTTPDKHDRRKRGKNDDLDAQNAPHGIDQDLLPALDIAANHKEDRAVAGGIEARDQIARGVGGAVVAAPIAYAVNGVEYLAVAAGDTMVALALD